MNQKEEKAALGNLLRKTLDTLPFNGEKTKLALWAALLAFLQVITGYDFGVAVDPTLTLPISLIAACVFIAHKLLKRKYSGLPSEWGEAMKK